MGGRTALSAFLKRLRVVAAGTMVFIYHLQDHPRYVPATRVILDAWRTGSHQSVTSALSRAEMLVRPLKGGEPDVAEDYRRVLTTFPNLRLVDVDRAVAGLAARLRALQGLQLPDAIQAATAIVCGATAMVANDPVFRRVKGGEILLLGEVAPAARGSPAIVPARFPPRSSIAPPLSATQFLNAGTTRSANGSMERRAPPPPSRGSACGPGAG